MEITGAGLLVVAGGIIAVGGAAAVVWRALRPVAQLVGRTNEFLDDWFGTPDRPGVPGRQGVMPRLAHVEASKADRKELKELIQTIAEKADRDEVIALRAVLDQHIQAMEERPEGPSRLRSIE